MDPSLWDIMLKKIPRLGSPNIRFLGNNNIYPVASSAMQNGTSRRVVMIPY